MLGYLFFIGNELTTVQKRKTEELNLLQQWALLAPKVQGISYHSEQIGSMKTIFADVLKQLPPQPNVEELLDNISVIGKKEGVKFILLKPEEKKAKGFYAELPIQVEVEGDYHQIANFISHLANLKQFMTFRSMEIRSLDTVSELSEEKLQLQLDIVLYHSAKGSHS